MYFRCTVKGCDSFFINVNELEKHIKSTTHCPECGASELTVVNPLDKQDCIDCEELGNYFGEEAQDE